MNNKTMDIDIFLSKYREELKEFEGMTTTEKLELLLDRNKIREAIYLVKEGE